MRFIAMTILLLTMLTPAIAKDWFWMNGRERRQHVMAYVESRNLQCRVPSNIRTMRQAEMQLALIPSWAIVAAGIPRYCKKGPPKVQAVKAKPVVPQALAQESETSAEGKDDTDPKTAGIAARPLEVSDQ